MAASDLCSIADVREFIQKPTGDTDQDAVIAALITRASLAVMGWCEREFAPESAADVVRTFQIAHGDEWLSLAPHDLQSASLVQVDTDTTAYTLSTDEYRFDPPGQPNGVYTSVRLRPLSVSTSGRQLWPTREVQITGTWGFPSVPEDVKHAAVVTTAIWLRRDVQAFSSVFRLDEGSVERPEALPSAVKGVLAPWRRMGL
jgi:hypothetical protein